jgi:hypothetical protein
VKIAVVKKNAAIAFQLKSATKAAGDCGLAYSPDFAGARAPPPSRGATLPLN